MNTDPKKSAQPCGCDEGANYVCRGCQDKARLTTTRTGSVSSCGEVVGPLSSSLNGNVEGQRTISNDEGPTSPVAFLSGLGVVKQWQPLSTIQDSGKRVTYASGSMRDPSTGKIKWSRILYGPMARRWAQHLTTAEAKYPDVKPGVPNFMLIETDEEYFRYKESALRHFLSWYYDETDEDHASATYFNVNGVEVIKDKWRKAGTHAELLGQPAFSKGKGA